MTLDEITRAGVDPALAILPVKLDTPRARLMLLTIALQESRLIHRRQLVGRPPQPTGPAKSFWQGEQGGGMVAGVRAHAATRDMAKTLYAAAGVEPTNAAIWNAIEHDDMLAAGLARLLLWSDPAPLPAPHDVEAAWQLYLRTWRPGAWARGSRDEKVALRLKWATNHRAAHNFVLLP